jgi:hypothetical protein
MIREAAAVTVEAAEVDGFAALLIEALSEDPDVRAAVQDAARRDPPPRTRTGGGRRG